MSCGCKEKTVKPSESNTPISIKKILLILLASAIFILVSPIILVMIWYLSIRLLIMDDSNYIVNTIEYFKKFFNKEEKEEEYKEINPEDYELMDVDIIK